MKPKREQVAFLCERLVGGNNIEAQAAVDMLLADPAGNYNNRVYGPIEDDRLPLLRRILIDRTAAAWDFRIHGRWGRSASRIVRLEQWTRSARSSEEVESLCEGLCDLTSATYSVPWPNAAEADKRIGTLVAIAESLENKPLATVHAKQDAVRALTQLSSGSGRRQAFPALVRAAKDPSEVGSCAISYLSGLAPYSAAEGSQIEELLKGMR